MVTTQTTTRGSALARSAPALCVVLALAIGAGAWLVPSAVFEPEVGPVVTRPIPGEEAGDGGAWRNPEPKEWTELIEHVEEIREPDRVVADNDRPDAESEQESDTPPAEVVRRPTVQRPPWGYEGFIMEPGGRVAVVRTNSGQRLVYEGETILLGGARGESLTYVVSEVGPRVLVLTSGEDRFEYELQETTARMTPNDPRRRAGVMGDEPIEPSPAAPPVREGERG